MKYSYRITKYQSNNNDIIHSEEWSSYFDVGDKVDINDYLKVEYQYISLIKFVCNEFNLKQIRISDLEIYIDKPNIKNNQLIKIDDLDYIIKSILREEIWGKLKGNCFEFHFGYDFYMYLISQKDILDTLKENYPSLNIEDFISPYAD